MEKNLEQTARGLVSNIATSLDRDIGGRIKALEVLVSSPLADDQSRLPELYRVAQGFRDNYGGQVIFADLSMQMLFNTRVPLGTVLPKLPKPKGFAAVPAVLETGRPAVGDTFFGPIAKLPLVAAVVPVSRDSKIRFLLLSIIETSLLQESLDKLVLPADWTLTVLDSKGELIARRAPANEPAPSADIKAYGRFTVASTVAPWSVTLEIPRSGYLEPIIKTAAALLSTILAAILLGFLCGGWASRRLTKAVTALTDPTTPSQEFPAIREFEAVRSRLASEASERQQAEEELRDSEARFRKAIEEAPFPIMIHAEDGAVVTISRAWSEISGYTRAEIPTIGDWTEQAYGKRMTGVRAEIDALYDLTSRKAEGEYPIRCKDGAERTWEFSSVGLGRRADGRRLAISMAFDVTERKRLEVKISEQLEKLKHSEAEGRRLLGIAEASGGALLSILEDQQEVEEKLRQSQDLLLSVTEGTSDAIYVKDLQGRYLMFNAGAARFVGKSSEEVLGKDDTELFPPEDARQIMAGDNRVIESGIKQTYEECVTTADGVLRTFQALKGPVHDAQGTVIGLFGIARDITESKRTEAALRESEARLSLTLELTKIGIWDWDLKKDVWYATPTYFRMLGYDPDVDGQNREVWGARTHPDDRERVINLMVKVRDEGLSGFDHELRFRAADGNYVWLNSVGRGVEFDEEGKATRMLGLQIDITARKEAEQELLLHREHLEELVTARTLELAEANRELETFTYSVSHDLRAPLRGIDGYSRLLETDYQDCLDEEGLKFLLNIRRGAAQMSLLIEDLLNYSRLERRTLQRIEIDLPSLVQAVVDERQLEVSEKGSVLHLAVPPLTVCSDRDGLTIALRNLLENALKFSADAQPPTITIGARSEPGKILLWVRDNGIGFEMKYHNRIFEIFQRLQRSEDFPGTGIGLSLVNKAMSRMGGRVWAESSPGEGATFYLEIPS